MFTGIIENLGTIKKWVPHKEGGKFTIKPKKKISKIKIGESIAINGCCLTVIQDKTGNLVFDVSDETMRKTAMHKLKTGDTVNIERAMQGKDRFGGHFVLGHVDGIGKIKNIIEHDGSVEYQIQYPKKFSQLLIEKGSVCIDGISLTVCDLKKTCFSVYIIPHTLKETNLMNTNKGDLVNLEFDVLGKYISRFLELRKS